MNISSHSVDHRSTSGTDHIVPSNQSLIKNSSHPGVILLKRSNSMICPQQHLQVYLNQNNNNNNNNSINHRNSICFELAGCSTDESSTDDYQLIKSSSSTNRYWSKPINSTMTDIEEHENISSIEQSTINPIIENDEEEKGIKKILFVYVNHILS